MLWSNNKNNEEIGNSIETGAFQFFECPPLAFSPVNEKVEGQNHEMSFDSNNYNSAELEK